MKQTYVRHLVIRMALILSITGPAWAVPGDFTNLYVFGGGSSGGQWPMTAPIEQGGVLFGMTQMGGVSNFGVISGGGTGGTGYTNLVSFNGVNGAYPFGRLTKNGSYFYGMTARGGTWNNGVIFRIATNGTGYTVLYHFNPTNVNSGAMPWGSLVLSGTNLYGMTYYGGVSNLGVIFRIYTSGSGYVNLRSFRGGAGDGMHPKGDLLLDGGKLYGVTSQGGAENAGVIFRMNVDGSGYMNLHEFAGGTIDGESPPGSLLKDGSYLYGTALIGPTKGGVVFSIHTNGGTLNLLHTFGGSGQNGCDPFGTLMKHDSKLYGTTRYGGTNWTGVIYSLGGTYSNVYTWSPGVGEPLSDGVFIGDQLYSSTLKGGVSGRGSLFRYSVATGDTAAAWCAVTWIENQPLSTVTAGDYCGDRFWVRHSKGAGRPDRAYVGYGKTQNFDDKTWKWIPMTEWADVGSDYEYTGRIGRASAGNYYTAAKFIKGSHVYYAATINAWGDWNTQLYSPNTWTVRPLTPPSNCSATAYSSSQINLSWNGDGSHWVTIFRKTTNVLTPPVDDTGYIQGYEYADQGVCVYKGSASSFSDTGLTGGKTYYYQFVTENYGYYSSGRVASASTPGGGGGGSLAMKARTLVLPSAPKPASLQPAPKTSGSVTEAVLFQDDFSDGRLDGWRPADQNVSWSVTPTFWMHAEGAAADSYSYSVVQNLDVANRNIAVEYDVQYGEGALHAGLIYRGRVLYIHPALCGWADDQPVYKISPALASNTAHHVSVYITEGTPYASSDLFVDGQPVFVNEPVEVGGWTTNTLGFLSAYGPSGVDWDNVRVLEIPSKP